MTPIKCIDAVLELLDKDESLHPYASGGQIMAALQVKYPEFQEGTYKQGMDTIRILNKLVKDGYIDCKEETNMDDVGSGIAKGHKMYFITFEGALFSQQNGYAAELRMELAESIRVESMAKNQIWYQRSVTWLTVLIAVGTSVAAVYYGIEIWKYYQACP